MRGVRELVALYGVVVRGAVGPAVVGPRRLLREVRVRRWPSVGESRLLLPVAGRAGDVDAAASLLLGRVRGPVGRGIVVDDDINRHIRPALSFEHKINLLPNTILVKKAR